jgi:hypothetical protein
MRSAQPARSTRACGVAALVVEELSISKRCCLQSNGCAPLSRALVGFRWFGWGIRDEGVSAGQAAMCAKEAGYAAQRRARLHALGGMRRALDCAHTVIPKGEAEGCWATTRCALSFVLVCAVTERSRLSCRVRG